MIKTYYNPNPAIRTAMLNQIALPVESKLLWSQTIYGIPPSKKNNYEPISVPLKGAKAFYVCWTCRRITDKAGCNYCYQKVKRYYDKSRPMLLLTDEARKYQEDFAYQCRKPVEPIDYLLVLNATIFYPDRRHDLEGDVIIMDSLQKARVIKNDVQFFEKHIYKKVQQPDPRVELELWSFQ